MEIPALEKRKQKHLCEFEAIVTDRARSRPAGDGEGHPVPNKQTNKQAYDIIRHNKQGINPND